MPSTERIAITGMGVVSPIGQGVNPYWESLVTSASGIATIERFSTEGMRVKSGGEIKTLSALPESSALPFPHCRASQFLVLAAREALEMAHWHESSPKDHRFGVVIGSALGGIGQAERLLKQPRDLHALTGALYDGPTRNLAHWLGANGPVITVSTACASGATSLGVAADLLRAGTATAVIAGGVDILLKSGHIC